MKLEAFSVYPAPEMALVPADWKRWWMTPTAQKCLPIRIASEIGWWLLNPSHVEVHWNGHPGIDDMTVRGHPLAASHFGEGIVTFNVPYLFRTEPGWSLLVQGPINGGKGSIHPLTGIIETDKVASTFTMNWRMHRAGTVTFADGEPIAQLVPVPSNIGVDVEPVIRDIDSVPELAAAYKAWADSRAEHNQRWDRGEESRRQGHYGRQIEHGRLRTREFEQDYAGNDD